MGVVQRATGLPSAPARAVLDLLTEIVFDPSRLPKGLLRCLPTLAPSQRRCDVDQA